MSPVEIIQQFQIEGKVLEVKPMGEGFINDTLIVKTEGEAPDYILQRKNHLVFPDVPAMMDNIVAVTEHIKAKVADPSRETLTVIPTIDGKYYYQDGENFWAVCTLIPEVLSYVKADTVDLAYQGGVGIGRFQTLLADFDKTLAVTLKGFHDMAYRFEEWDKAIREDKAGRVASVQEEISWIESRRKEMSDFYALIQNGTIPTRVAHNDTKISNILFNTDGSVLCAIDLDTVMSSTSLNDVGDALRSYTNTTFEDDPNYENVAMDIRMFEAWIKGYLSERKDTLTDSEKEYLAFSGRFITYEQVLRFLMDYINGDTYYKIKYPEHNLVRTRSQYALLCSMEAQYETMQNIVKDLLRA